MMPPFFCNIDFSCKSRAFPSTRSYKALLFPFSDQTHIREILLYCLSHSTHNVVCTDPKLSRIQCALRTVGESFFKYSLRQRVYLSSHRTQCRHRAVPRECPGRDPGFRFHTEQHGDPCKPEGPPLFLRCRMGLKRSVPHEAGIQGV